MAGLINHAVLAEIKSLYPYLKMRPFTRQQETLLMLTLEGASVAAAARGAGYSTTANAKSFLETDRAVAVMKYFSEMEMEKITITRDRLTAMALECYGERGNAMEGLKAVDTLARLHGQNEETRQRQAQVTINQQNNTTIVGAESTKALKKKMAAMSDDELLQYAGQNLQNLDLEPQPVEGEVIDAVPIEEED